ncbi:MAG TPA: DUF485 domain-containing protein [Gemmatimonadaceae bacterium]|nr:DUF485 domain-containing protein [Gemmatimonadaceae bacterium]
MPDSHDEVRALARARWRIAIVLTVIMIAVYFGFIALIAFDKPLLATRIAPGLTLGILLGVLVIVVSWLLTWVYVRWANAHYDARLEALRR